MKTSLQSESSKKSKSVANNLSSSIQSKLKIGQPNDKYEQEAEQTANRVMMMTEPNIQRQEDREEELQAKLNVQRQPEEEEEPVQAKFFIQRQPIEEEEEVVQSSIGIISREGEEQIQRKPFPQLQAQEQEEEQIQPKYFIQRQTEEEEEPIQAKPILQKKTEQEFLNQKGNVWKDEKEEAKGIVQRNANEKGETTIDSSIESEINSKKGGGNPLPDSTRNFMENRFGADFTKVRVHHDSSAARLSSSINAQAFATGNHIFFNTGKYNPESNQGKHLLAHELTHTIQQGASSKHTYTSRKSSSSGNITVQRGILEDAAGAASEIISGISRAICTGVSAAYNWITNIVSHVGGGISGAWSWIRQTASILGLGVVAAWNWAYNFSNQIRMGIRTAMGWIINLSREIGSGILSAAQWALNLGRQLLRTPLSAVEWIRLVAAQLRSGILTAFNWIRGFAQRIAMGITEAWNWILRISGELALSVLRAFDWLVSVAIRLAMGITAAYNWLRGVAALIHATLMFAWSFMTNVVRALRMGFQQALTTLIGIAIQVGVSLLTMAWNMIRTIASQARMTVISIYNLIVRLASTIGRTFMAAWHWILNIARRIGRGILAAWNWIVSTARGIGLAIQITWNFLVRLARRLAKSIYDAVDWWLNAPSISHQTVRAAPDGSSNSRNDIGVGEVVNFTGSKTGRWTASGGDPVLQNTGTSFRWTAPNRAANVRISLESGRYTNHVNLNILEPTSIRARKIREIRIPRGVQGAGMRLDFNYLPKSVNFGNLEAKEVSGPATNIEGYYRHDGSTHYHDSGDTFFGLDTDNSLPPDTFDTAKQEGYPSPWYRGSFRWIIPNRFRVNTETGDGKEFTRVTQAFTLFDRTGRTKITKAGEEVDRTP